MFNELEYKQTKKDVQRESRSKDTIQINMFKQRFKKLFLHSEGIMFRKRTLISAEFRPELLAAMHDGRPDRDSIWCAIKRHNKQTIKLAIWWASWWTIWWAVWWAFLVAWS